MEGKVIEVLRRIDRGSTAGGGIEVRDSDTIRQLTAGEHARERKRVNDCDAMRQTRYIRRCLAFGVWRLLGSAEVRSAISSSRRCVHDR